MRKEADFDVTDRITIAWQGDDQIDRALSAMKAYICGETLATDILKGTLPNADTVKTWDIEGVECTILLKKIPSS
jgi:isoleucyl-tRNA synthetase